MKGLAMSIVLILLSISVYGFGTHGDADTLQQGFVAIKSYGNYAPNGMPDFDQKQDKWQKIDPGNDGNITSAVDPNDILLPTCIAPGNDGDLDSTPGGDDVAVWYYCGSVSAANVLWWIDSKHEKNNYPDNNQDTCNLVASFPGVADDHASANVPPLVVNLATAWIGTSNACTTTVNMIAGGMQAKLNAAGLSYNVKTFQNPTIHQMWNWINGNYGVILRLDISPTGGHFVSLNSVDNQNNQIGISDSWYDGKKSPSNHVRHNDAGMVNHDVYGVTSSGGSTAIPNYAGGYAVITDAIVAVPKLILIAYIPHQPLLVNCGTAASEEFVLDCYNESVENIEACYYLPGGIAYAGNATVNGAPYEPLVEGNMLKWSFPNMSPGQQYDIKFDVTTDNPKSLELERYIRCWGFCPMWSSYVYDDDFGVMEIIDENPPVIQSVQHSIYGSSLTISCYIFDDTSIGEAKVVMTDPSQVTNQYNMVGKGYKYTIKLDCTGWEEGEYNYYIWTSDIAGNENISDEYGFTLTGELTADAGGPYSGYENEEIQFHGSAEGGEPPYTWYWDFGDGNTSSERNATHVFGDEGNYTVILEAYDSIGNNDSDRTYATVIKRDTTPPEVSIIKPKNGLYLFDRNIISLNSVVVIGKITIEANATDNESSVENVTFHIDGELRYEDSEAPYEWLWDERAIGSHEIMVKAYDGGGNTASDETNVMIFNI